jgi:hypothetical protein
MLERDVWRGSCGAEEKDSHHVVGIGDDFLEEEVIGTFKSCFQCTFPFLWSCFDHCWGNMD